MNVADLGMIAGFVLTLMVFSYLLGDNFLYRLAVYVFVGLAAGFVTIVTVESVVVPWVESTLGGGSVGEALVGIVPFFLVALLLLKTSARLAPYGNLGLAFIIGVGTAVAIVGALTGTLMPLARATAGAARGAEGREVLDAAILLVGVVSTLIYFQYVGRRSPESDRPGIGTRSRPIRAISLVGQGFIAVTLGALYGAAILTSLTIVSERIGFLISGG